MEEHEYEQWIEDGECDFSGDPEYEAHVLGFIGEEEETGSGSEICMEGLAVGSASVEEEPDVKESIEVVFPQESIQMEMATPLEELLREVGVVNLTKEYRRASRDWLAHDFRWVAEPNQLMFRGEPVIAMLFPPAKVDLIPQSVLGNMSIREGAFSTVTGTGVHLFMGALPATPDLSCVCEIVTRKERCFFEITRTMVRSAQGPVRAWTSCGEYFNVAATIAWNDRLMPGDNIVMVDGDVWYYPEKRAPTVMIRKGQMVDRKGRELEKGVWSVDDGDYAFDLADRSLTPGPVRPPVSLEVFMAWKKMRRMPPIMFGVRKRHERFEVDPADYDASDRSKLIENPRLRSPAMMSRVSKYREMCKVWYLRHVSRNMFAFSAYELVAGRCWSDHEVVMAYVNPGVGCELVLTMEGCQAGWARVTVNPGRVCALTRYLGQRGDVIVTSCAVSRPRSYCTAAWQEERAKRVSSALARFWRAPDKIITLYVEEWLEYYAPPEPNDSLLRLFRN